MLEALENSSENTSTHDTNGFQKFLCIVDMKKLMFYYTNFFGSSLFVNFLSDVVDQKRAESKKW